MQAYANLSSGSYSADRAFGTAMNTTIYGPGTSSGRPGDIHNHAYHPATANNGNMDPSMSTLANNFANFAIAASNTPNGPIGMPAPVGFAGSYYFTTPNGQTFLAAGAIQNFAAIAPHTPLDQGFLPYHNNPQCQPHPNAIYPTGCVPSLQLVQPLTPARPAWTNRRPEVAVKDVPGLEDRRGSCSTNDSEPGTPFYGTTTGGVNNTAAIAVSDRSPVTNYGYGTPSPQHMSHPFANQAATKPMQKCPSTQADDLAKISPAIPRAVPAVFTPPHSIKTLEQSLYNNTGDNRNVYIRGLHPHTNDETLAAYAARYGQVEQSKAIVDPQTGACKG